LYDQKLSQSLNTSALSKIWFHWFTD
jgi:hypothetical protein